MSPYFRRVVVGCDGSPTSQRAVMIAADLVAADGEIHLVTAYNRVTAAEVEVLAASVPSEFRPALDPVATPRGHLEEAERMLEPTGVGFVGHLVGDDPASAILDVAADVDADLIVVGSRDIRRSARFLRGSVSSRIAAHAPTSVLVVHDK